MRLFINRVLLIFSLLVGLGIFTGSVASANPPLTPKIPIDHTENSLGVWGNIRIDTEPSYTPTADEIRYIYARQSESLMLKSGSAEALLASSKKYGVNPIILATMAVHESTWGTSNLAKVANNLGGVRCTDRGVGCVMTDGKACVTYTDKATGRPCYTKFASVGDYFEDKGWFLKKYYIDEGINTMQAVLNKYAEGHNGYLQTMRSAAYTRIGMVARDIDTGVSLTPDPSVQVGNGASGEGGGRPEFSSNDVKIFKEAMETSAKTGMANTGEDNALESPYVRYSMVNFSRKTYNIMMIVANVIIALSIAYMAVMVATYALYVRGSVGHEKTAKIIGSKLADTYGERKGILMIVQRMALGTFVIIFFYSKYHIHLSAYFYKFLQDILHVL